MSGEKETFLRLIGKRSAGEVADRLERSSSDQVTFVAQALVALAEHLDESAPTWLPIGSATESAEPKASQPDKPGLPRGECDDAEVMRIWRECGLPEWFLGNGGSNHKLVAFQRSLIEELDRYRSAAHGR
jgi:hypothetical protein